MLCKYCDELHGHGKGKMTSEDGDMYESDFVESFRHGKGKLTFEDDKIE